MRILREVSGGMGWTFRVGGRGHGAERMAQRA